MYSVLDTAKALGVTRQAIYQVIKKEKLTEKGYITSVNGKRKITQAGLDYLMEKKSEKDPKQKLLFQIQEELDANKKIIERLKKEIEIEKEQKLFYKEKWRESEKINIVNEAKIELMKKEIEEYQEFISSNFFVRIFYNFRKNKLYLNNLG